MNQILTTKPVKQKKYVDIKKVIAFFAISLIVFGLCVTTSGAYSLVTSINSKPRKTINSNTDSNYNNNTTESNTQYEEIEINLQVEGANILANVVGESEISFITYKWDDEEETTEQINAYSKEVTIKIPSGQHTLTVTAVDVNNKEKTIEQKVKGVSKPKINVIKDNNSKALLVEVTDELGIKNIKIVFNGQTGELSLNGETEKSIKCPLKEGENTIEVTAVNNEEVSDTFSETYNN